MTSKPRTISALALAMSLAAGCATNDDASPAPEAESTDLAQLQQAISGSGGARCRLALRTGTFRETEAALETQIWWDREAVAKLAANLVGTHLGFPNGPAPGAGRLGPMFAFALTPFECGTEQCASWSAYTVAERTGEAGLFSNSLVPAVPPETFTFAVIEGCGSR